MRVVRTVAVGLNGAELAMATYSVIANYVDPVGDAFVPLWAILLFLSVPAMSLLMLVWAAVRLSRPRGL